MLRPESGLEQTRRAFDPAAGSHGTARAGWSQEAAKRPRRPPEREWTQRAQSDARALVRMGGAGKRGEQASTSESGAGKRPRQTQGPEPPTTGARGGDRSARQRAARWPRAALRGAGGVVAVPRACLLGAAPRGASVRVANGRLPIRSLLVTEDPLKACSPSCAFFLLHTALVFCLWNESLQRLLLWKKKKKNLFFSLSFSSSSVSCLLRQGVRSFQRR